MVLHPQLQLTLTKVILQAFLCHSSGFSVTDQNHEIFEAPTAFPNTPAPGCLCRKRQGFRFLSEPEEDDVTAGHCSCCSSRLPSNASSEPSLHLFCAAGWCGADVLRLSCGVEVHNSLSQEVILTDTRLLTATAQFGAEEVLVKLSW